MKTEGTGVLTFQSAQTVNMAATLQMAAGKRITDGGDAVTFGDKVDMDGNRVVNMGTPINDMDSATKKYVDDKFEDVIGGAPAALDTLNELANALGDDADYAATITTALATKATTVYVDQQVAQAVINANSTSSATTDALDLRLTAVESTNTSQATAIAANSAAHVQNASDIAANSTAVETRSQLQQQTQLQKQTRQQQQHKHILIHVKQQLHLHIQQQSKQQLKHKIL